ncbi:hypothetical protein B0H13DRAFT_112543 [Mycena leptocephala]|nr:hypothetical protein B0H13DRAFT_112543 [Mycena leptocephala]
MASQPAANGEYLCDLEASVVARPQFTSFQTDVIEWGTKNTFRWLPLSLLGICRILLVGGIAATGIGYIGCFSLIQDANTSIKGPGIWLAVEIILCIIRLIVWASNPGFDDPPPPIVIHQYQGVNQTKVAYNIGWMLNDDAMLGDLHAVVIGIDQVPSSSIPKLKCAINDARSVVTYLHDDLAVPEHQITSLLGESATSGAIEAALERLATYNDIPQGAPIVLFMACPIVYASVRPRGALTFVTFEYDGDQPGTGLAYTKLLGLLQTIAVSKGNNITVILDTCFDGIGRYQMFDPAAVFSIGYSSHVLLAASSGFHERETEEGGVFTRVLLKQLRMHTDVHSTRVFTQTGHPNPDVP